MHIHEGSSPFFCTKKHGIPSGIPCFLVQSRKKGLETSICFFCATKLLRKNRRKVRRTFRPREESPVQRKRQRYPTGDTVFFCTIEKKGLETEESPVLLIIYSLCGQRLVSISHQNNKQKQFYFVITFAY